MENNECRSCKATPEECEKTLRKTGKACCVSCSRTDTHGMTLEDWRNLKEGISATYRIYIRAAGGNGEYLYGSSVLDALKQAKGIYLSSVVEFKIYKRPDNWEEINLDKI